MLHCIFLQFFFFTEGNSLHRLALRSSCATWDTIPRYIWDSHTFFDRQSLMIAEENVQVRGLLSASLSTEREV